MECLLGDILFPKIKTNRLDDLRLLYPELFNYDHRQEFVLGGSAPTPYIEYLRSDTGTI